MKITLFCHADFFRSQSMPRFAEMLKVAYLERGLEVESWRPQAFFSKLTSRTRLEKWGRYLDQYLMFPWWVRIKMLSVSRSTLFVFCDQAMGPWIHLVGRRPHVVHVHDLLALRSAVGDIKDNPTSATGRIYQSYIRRGLSKARHFICTSNKTREDLIKFAVPRPDTASVVYNGLNYPYCHMPRGKALELLEAAGLRPSVEGMLLHVGGGQWYKNLRGVIKIYTQYVYQTTQPLSLWCVGPAPSAAIRELLSLIPTNGRVLFVTGLPSDSLQAIYSIARLMLFPSLEEGFGWPLVEALCCGCAVLTTDEPPMNELAGDAVCYHRRLRMDDDIDAWAREGADMMREMLSVSDATRESLQIAEQFRERFDAKHAIEDYLKVYTDILESYWRA